MLLSAKAYLWAKGASMLPSGYHIILIPSDTQRTKRVRLSSLTARLVVVGIVLVVPAILGALFLTIHYQNELVEVRRKVAEERQIVESKEVLLKRIETLATNLAHSEQSLGKLETALDVELGGMKAGLGPIEKDFSLDKKMKEIPHVMQGADPMEDRDGLSLRDIRQKMSQLDGRIAGFHSKIEEMYELNADKIRFLNATPNTMPVDGWITSSFGYRTSPYSGVYKMHYGLDIASPIGTPIRAPADGRVLLADYRGGYGKNVILSHGYGVTTVYGHASQIYVTEGQTVKKGDIIAAVGSTGSSTGPHVHYEVHVDGIPTDPMNYLIN
jgi:murein DD-endopeptidase MepM/ murein hydrolase activator NlpD